MKKLAAMGALVPMFVLCACSTTASQTSMSTATKSAKWQSDNPFFASTWDTPYGAPPFHRIETAHYGPAFDAGMAAHNQEIEAIAKSAEPATFANTIEALEYAGRMLSRVSKVFFNLAESMSDEAMQQLQRTYAPKLSQHYDRIVLNDALFARVRTVYEARDTLGLKPEQQKLLTDTHRRFVQAGALLSPDAKAELMTLNARLAVLYAEFGARIRNANANYLMVLEAERDLEGLPQAVLDAAAATAKERGHAGKYGFTLVRSSIQPFLMYAKNRDRRKEIYTAYISRGAHEGDGDTRPILKEAALLRARRARLMGYPSHAHYQIDANMAKTPEAVYGLLRKLWDGALPKAKQEHQALAGMIRKDLGGQAKLQPWDWRYYTEKLRKERYDLSEDLLKPYFEVDAVREGAFHTATRLWGLKFAEVTAKVPVYHPEVKAFDVMNADGSHVGLLYVDYHPRASKSGGAWMDAFRSQEAGVRPVIVNVGNFPAPTGDKPALLGWDEVNTLFHEFGHALHGLLSNVHYAGLSGTHVKQDYVEFPSQLLENWALEPEVLQSFARHYETGKPIPKALIAKIKETATFNKGFAMAETVAAALLDLKWHTLDEDGVAEIKDIAAFDQAAMAEIGMIDTIAPRYHSPYFQHIFAGDNYSAGYYVYLWAQVLEADAYHAFTERKSPFHQELAQKLREFVFEAGGSREEMDLYIDFRGKKPTAEAMLRKNGLRP